MVEGVAGWRRLRPVGIVAIVGAGAFAGSGFAPGSAETSSKAGEGPKAGKSIASGSGPGKEWPFVVAIRERGRFECSGSVVSPTAVLTAAHCVRNVRRMSVVTGTTNIQRGGQRIGVAGAVKHPGWNGKAYDIAMLRLASPTNAPPIAIADPALDAALMFRGQTVGIAGFGNRVPWLDRKEKVGRLRAARVRLGKRCFGDPFFVPRLEICTNNTKRRGKRVARGPCPGDSGGPMVLRLGDGPRVFGVSSEGADEPPYVCGDPKGLGIYSRVSAAADFVRAHL